VNEPPLIVCGIDPGLRCTGYGLLSCSGGRIEVVESGAIRPPTERALAARLLVIYEQLGALLRRTGPGVVAIEEPYVNVNARSSMRLGEALAAALLAVASYGLEPALYSPAEVKQSVTGYGRGDKEQVQRMLLLQLGLSEPPRPADAADALAVALCHATRVSGHALLQESGRPG
jgi:crossover junction endodeoxyribonuclease RuvC